VVTAPDTIVAAFDAAAATYDPASQLQLAVAERLLAAIPSSCQPQTILELGCGTGILTTGAMARWPQAHLTALDAAPAMLAQLRRKLPQVQPVCADANAFVPQQAYDLILSSMLLHWLPQPQLLLQRWQSWLNRGGVLAVALPVAGSLPEWQTLCAAAGMADRRWLFPPAKALSALPMPQTTTRLTMRYPTVRDFLHSLKATGAHSGAAVPSLPIGGLRRLLRHTASQPFAATYAIRLLIGQA
jgi:malonyl-CoA O-methyltransferase